MALVVVGFLVWSRCRNCLAIMQRPVLQKICLMEIDKSEYLNNTTVEEDMIFNKRFKEVEISSEEPTEDNDYREVK